jgi:hypothetical protein
MQLAIADMQIQRVRAGYVLYRALVVKVFSLQSFPLYDITFLPCLSLDHASFQLIWLVLPPAINSIQTEHQPYFLVP